MTGAILGLIAACAQPDAPRDWLATSTDAGACGVAGCTSRGPDESLVRPRRRDEAGVAAAATVLRVLGLVPDEVGDRGLLALLRKRPRGSEAVYERGRGTSPAALMGLLAQHGVSAEPLDPGGELTEIVRSGVPIVVRMKRRYLVLAPTRKGRVVVLDPARPDVRDVASVEGRATWAAAFLHAAPRLTPRGAP